MAIATAVGGQEDVDNDGDDAEYHKHGENQENGDRDAESDDTWMSKRVDDPRDRTRIIPLEVITTIREREKTIFFKPSVLISIYMFIWENLGE